MRETLRVLVDRDVAVNREMPGPIVQVLAAGVDIEVAAGVADRATGAPLEPGMLFPDLLFDRVIQAGEPVFSREPRQPSAARTRKVARGRRNGGHVL
jgi:hypothetical protein